MDKLVAIRRSNLKAVWNCDQRDKIDNANYLPCQIKSELWAACDEVQNKKNQRRGGYLVLLTCCDWWQATPWTSRDQIGVTLWLCMWQVHRRTTSNYTFKNACWLGWTRSFLLHFHSCSISGGYFRACKCKVVTEWMASHMHVMLPKSLKWVLQQEDRC